MAKHARKAPFYCYAMTDRHYGNRTSGDGCYETDPDYGCRWSKRKPKISRYSNRRF